MKKISIQGEPGSYHDIAKKRYFSTKDKALNRRTFKQVFEDLAQNQADFAIVAIENTLYGSINEVYDALIKYNFWICGEIYLRIEHCLLAIEKIELNEIKEVYSHPVALAQCEDFLDNELSHAEKVEYFDTAGAAGDLKKWNDKSKAAIASMQAAEIHDLEIIQTGTETNKRNFTRFIVLRGEKPKSIDDNVDKTSLVLNTAHTPGALYNALGAFANRKINLSKLVSRPIVGRAWQYMFYIDIEAGLNRPERSRSPTGT